MSADLHPADAARSAPGPAGSRVTAAVLTFLRAHMIALSVIALLLLAYTLIGFLVVPRVARAQLQDYVVNTLHAQLELGELHFNPFALDASVSGAAIKDAAGAPLVGFRHLYVDAQLASIWRRAIVLREVEIAGPSADVVVARDGSVNLAQLAPPDEGEDEGITRVHIGRLAVRDGRVALTDRTHERPFRAQVAPIRFTLTDFRTDSGYRNAYRFAGVTSSGEELEWSGGFTVEPLGSTGQFSVRRLKLATVDAYLGDALPFQLASGEALVKGVYELALEPLKFDATLPLIAVSNLSLREHGSDAPAPISAASLEVKGVTISFGERKTAVQRIDILGARIDAARQSDGSIDIMRPLVAASDSSAGADSASSPEWSVQVNTIHVDGAALKAVDHMVTPPAQFDLAPATLTITNWSTDPNATVHVETDVGVNGKGRVLANGDVKLEPLAGALHVTLTDIPLPDAQPYLALQTAVTLHSGALAAKGDLVLAPAGGAEPTLRYSGNVSVANLRITDQHVKQDLLKWRDLALTGIEFQQQPDRLTIARIVARQPYASVIIAPDQTLNITRALERPGASEADSGDAAASESGEAAFPVVIRQVQVLDGAANFADLSIEPSFATAIMGLNGEVKGLSSDPASRAQVKLAGKVDKYAPVDITGEVNLLAATAYTDLAMNFRNMELTTFNPYSGRFAGYNISRGKLSTELRYKIEDRKLAAEHHIVVDNLEFGAKTDSKDAAPIPIKLGVALLKDRNGVIDVQLPVSGTLDDPKFRLGPIIWKAILGLLTKIVTAPFAALGALFGGGDELAYVDFPPGAAQLGPAETEKLSKLAQALVERPQLRLNVPLTAIGTEDADALARKALTEKLPPELADAAADPANEPRRRKALEAAYREQLKAAPEYPPDVLERAKAEPAAQSVWLEEALLAHLRPDDAGLDALARERARAVQDALLANAALNPERVFITNERSGAASESGLVRMEMKLE
jgi:hypothetical protein